MALGLQGTELPEHRQDVRVQLGSEEQVLQGHHVLLDCVVMLQTQKRGSVFRLGKGARKQSPRTPP